MKNSANSIFPVVLLGHNHLEALKFQSLCERDFRPVYGKNSIYEIACDGSVLNVCWQGDSRTCCDWDAVSDAETAYQRLSGHKIVRIFWTSGNISQYFGGPFKMGSTAVILEWGSLGLVKRSGGSIF